MSWFLWSQAFLFTAFVTLFVAGSKKELQDFQPLLPFILVVISLFAAYFCLTTQNGVHRAFLATEKVTKSYLDYVSDYGHDSIVAPLHYWEKPKIFH
jgi:hypothetical protein